MNLSISEKVRIIMKRKNVSMTELAEKLDMSRQNLSNKMSRDNFTEKDIREIAAALECEAVIEFHFSDGTII